MESDSRVKVYVRIKPTADFAYQNIELHPDKKSIAIHCKKDERRGYINNQVLDWKFSFDGILHNTCQETTYKTCASELVTRALDGYNSTLFAYGETGAGKTFTMTGTGDFKYRGIIPRALTQLYREIDNRQDHDISIKVSYMQIYRDKIYDLLEPNSRYLEQLSVTEDNNGSTYVKGLTIRSAKSEEEALSLLFEGESNRFISHHKLNRYSSRSHCIFSVFIESHSRSISGASYVLSRLNLVDLAGSERIGKTQCEGKAQEEALYINKSLTFLEQAVIALADEGRDHIPFRQSKLTHVLKDSLGGKCQTVMIGNIWGEQGQLEETLSTLRFGNRVMRIPNVPAINLIYDPIKVCQSLEREISDLRKELSMYDTLTNRRQITYEPLSETQMQEIKGQVRKFVDGEIDEIEIINVRQVKQVFEQFKTLVRQAEEGKAALGKMKNNMQHESSKIVQGNPDPASIMQNIDVEFVGETDGQNFGVGVAPSSAKAANTPAGSNVKKAKSRKGKPDSSGADTKRSPSPSENIKQTTDSQDKPSSTGHVAGTRQMTSPTRPRTPPPKSESFEQFRNERGKELNIVFLENKEIVKSKKMEAKELIAELNTMKAELEKCKANIEAKRREREIEDQVENEDELIIEEDEFLLLKKISDLKLECKMKFETLQNIRSDLVYCENLVKQCRQRLLSEFEAWYTECFVPVDENSDKLDDSKSEDSKKGLKSVRIVEDEQEKFDRLQMELLMENPDSVPFYNAKLQTERRQLYSGSTANRRKPGSIVYQVKNKPPTSLTIN
ncbi:kinesin-like protein KIF9 [Rhopilema esculentum]|uniref:kinesin-like protein KIF9 n=1 Tax=Rhopilema esculentum TaxID=499914 RepID=UPI0031DFEF7C|eukprot:gene494-10172_t